jgi:RNA processing factor Prp31
MSKEKSNLINIDESIKKIVSLTTYNESEAMNKLIENNYDYIKVIKKYMEIPITKETNDIKSINQEIYKQIRLNLDNSMKSYREKNPLDIEDVKEKLKQSEERKNK